jgi:hypothetical protein
MPNEIYVERRKHRPRLPIRLEARIISPSDGLSLTCVVREISPAGARLEVEERWALPKAFSLHILGDSCSHFCAVVWREGKSVGIQFAMGQDRAWWDHARSLTTLVLRPLTESSLRTRPSFREEFHPLRRAPRRTRIIRQGKHFVLSELSFMPFGAVCVFSRQRKSSS